MQPSRRTVLGSLLAAPVVLRHARAAGPWPNKPITMVAPFSVGGATDRLARSYSQFLALALGQPIIVSNRIGAGGQTGTTWALAQPDDGYTLLCTAPMPYMGTNILLTHARYTLDSFAFINNQWNDTSVVLTNKERPYQTFGDLVEAIKKQPGKLTAGATFGSAGQITTSLMLDTLGLPRGSVRLVTFDSGGGVRSALAGNQVDFAIENSEGSETIRSFLRPLAVISDERDPAWDAPPINEALKSYNLTMPIISGSLRGLVAPAGFKAKHPDDYQKLVDVYRKTLEGPDYSKFLQDNTMGRTWYGPEKSTAQVKETFMVVERYKSELA